jgi:cobalt/nickel transport system permease protein
VEHGFLDKYADLKSPIHSIEPRVKTALLIAAVFVSSLTPRGFTERILLMILTALFLALLSRVPLRVYVLRFAVILPIVAVLSGVYSFSGSGFSWFEFFFYFSKASASFLFVLILVTTTKFESILSALRYFRFPIVIISILSFLYRYIFVIQDELERMLRAVKARTTANTDRRVLLKTYFNLTGILMLRSLERSERIHRTMLAKGFSAEAMYRTKPQKLGYQDILFIIFFTSAIILINFILQAT